MDEKLQKLKDWIAECDNIVFFGGAGVSTESGIPDFRGEKGIFTAISEYGYRPEIILINKLSQWMHRLTGNRMK